MKSQNIATYRRIITYSRPYLGRIALAIVASIGVAASDVATAKLVEPLVDYVLGQGRNELINIVPLIVIGLALFKGIARFIQEYYIKTAGQLAVQDIRNEFFAHSINLSMRYFSKTASGQLVSRLLNDVNLLQRSAADVIVEVVRESFTLIGLAALAFYTDWRLALVAFLVLPVAVIPAAFIGRRIKHSTRQGQARMGNLTHVLQEAYAGVKVIKAFGTETNEIQRFRNENLGFYRYMRKVLKYDSASAPVIELLAASGLAGVLWYGIHRVIDGAISQGELLSFLVAVAMMYTPVKRLTKASNNIQKAIGASERVFEVLDEEADIKERPNPLQLEDCKGLVEFENVDFAYDDEPVLSGFSVDLRQGEVVALVGPSGAGKTTTVGLLTRFYDPNAGRILIDGHDIRDLSLRSLRDNIAMVDQETFLFNESIRNNIRYGRNHASDDEVEKAAGQAYADEFIRQMPEGYDTVIGDRGVRLSGGQRQRLCIARAILKDAPILILDEATSALDTESEQVVQKALANLMKNRTTLVIAHRLSTVMHANQIVVLEQGRVVETGRHQELLDSDGLYRKLYDMQFRDA